MARRSLARRGSLVVAAVLVGVALALAIDIARDGGLDAWLSPGLHESPGPTYEARGVTVAVDGRAVYLDCRGAGTPTVILETGFGGGADGWGTVLDGLAAISRTCAWDRPGIGRSTPRGLHSGAEVADDLRSALAAAGERGPYIAVAHSLGGIYARLFAAAGGSSVVGLVMLDTYDPDLGMVADPALDQAFRAEIQRTLDDGVSIFRQGEELDLPATLPELQAANALLPDTLLLYTDPYGRYHEPDQEAKVSAWYRAVRHLFPRAELEIVPGSSHFIQFDRPDLVIDRVRSMILGVRAADSPGSSG